MYKLLFTVSFFISLIFISCANDDSVEVRVTNPESIEVLTGVKLNASENLYEIMDIALSNIEGEYFALITDATKAPPVHLINVSEDSYISGLSREGRGPGEFSQPNSISVFDGAFIITDPANSRLTHIPEEVFKNSDLRGHSKFKVDNIQFPGLALSVLPINSDNYVVVGPIRTNENHRFALINPDENTNRFFGSHDSIDPNIDPNTIQLNYREYGTVSNKNSMFATGKYHKDQIDIFDFDGNLHTSYRGPDYDKLDFEVNEGRYVLKSENNIISYVDITSNSDYIYALYSGKKLNQSQRNFGNFVVVIDWEGNYIQSFQLDQQAFSLAVSDENSFLLAGVITEEAGLYMYRINE